MKHLSIITAVCCLLCLSMKAETIVIDGFYQGKDLYVKNPNGPQGVGFCVFEVQVNDEVTADEINSNAFIIDLHSLGLEIGEPITVQILHHDECRPKVLNLDAVLPQSTFELSSIAIDSKGVLNWETKNEMGELPYFVQQFKWNKWVTIGEVIGTGRRGVNSYSFQVEAHTGRNIYRVAQKTNKGNTRYTEEVTFTATQSDPVIIASKRVKSALDFSMTTHYEIFDEYGRLVKRGYDQQVDVSALNSGRYYINYDSRFGESFSKL